MTSRILVKLSGEGLSAGGMIYSQPALMHFAKEIECLSSAGYQVAIVLGGGNIWRGASGVNIGIDRVSADYVGMMATMMNGRVFHAAMKKYNPERAVRIMTAQPFSQAGEDYVCARALSHLEKCRVLILVGGTGNPLRTTDSAAAQLAIELRCDIVLKATNVKGVYDSDPNKNPDAKMYTNLGYGEAVSKKLKVMDMTAFTLCEEHQMPIRVFCGDEPNSFLAAARGEIGTLVS